MKDVNMTVLENVDASYRYEKGRYDKHIQEQKLYEGQAVWLRMYPQTLTKSRKLMKPNLGPCIVVKRVSGAIYKIRLPRGIDKCVHGNRLKPYYGIVGCKRLQKIWIPLGNQNVKERDGSD